jgi:hypothetical protein
MPFPLGKLADPVRVISTIREYIVCGSNVLGRTERSRYVVFQCFLRCFVSRDILSLICRFCIFVVRNALYTHAA